MKENECRWCEDGSIAVPSNVKPGGFVHILDFGRRKVCPPIHPDPETEAEIRADMRDANGGR